jgi:hypothetical protein
MGAPAGWQADRGGTPGESEPGYVSFEDPLAVYRFNPDGSLDPSFGGDGSVELERQNALEFRQVVVERNGDILLTGGRDWTKAGGGSIRLLRLSPAGQLDERFGQGCPRPNPPGIAAGRAAPLPDGFLLVGTRLVQRRGLPNRFVSRILRYTTNGCFDTRLSRLRIKGIGLASPVVSRRARPVISGLYARGVALVRLSGF